MTDIINLIDITSEDFVNYKKISTTLWFPKCDLKCDRDCGHEVCQNSSLLSESVKEFKIRSLIDFILNNTFSEAVVMQGLEPFESFDELYSFIYILRKEYKCDFDVVVYTGFYDKEIQIYIEKLREFDNIIIKYGRYIPNQEKHYDEVLGVYLASDNQYAERL